jgi:glycosyltransferase involved in cell wall biosynthesis
MQKRKPLISVVIPAYNNKLYTRRTLESVIQQDYRPFKVLLIDDASPDSLASLARWFEGAKDDSIQFTYVRNESNLSADGYYLWRELIDTEWCIQLHHDDWFIDPYFISNAVRQLTANPNLVVVWANAVTEYSKIRMVRDDIGDWRILSGPEFLAYFLLKGHTAWSAIVYKWSVLKENFEFPRPPFLIDRSTKATTNLDMDEGFSSFYLLSQLGDAAVSGKVVSIRGEPKTSYSRNAQWKTVSHSLFFIYMGCYIEEFDFKFSRDVRRIARLSTYLYGIKDSEGFLLPSILSYYKKSFFSVISMQYFLCWLYSAFYFSSYALKIGLKLRPTLRLDCEHSVLFLIFIVFFPLLLPRLILILIGRLLLRMLPKAFEERLRAIARRAL